MAGQDVRGPTESNHQRRDAGHNPSSKKFTTREIAEIFAIDTPGRLAKGWR